MLAMIIVFLEYSILFGRVAILDLQLSIEISNSLSVYEIVTNFKMADTKYSRNNSPRSKGDKNSKSRMKKSKHRSRSHHVKQSSQIECKTPPLPTSSSLDELLKKREDLKVELEKIVQQSHFDLEIGHNLHSKKSISKSSKTASKEELDTHSAKKIRKVNDDHIDDSHLDSEDEEKIIEQRRKQRKKLLEKLNSCKEKTEGNVDKCSVNDSDNKTSPTNKAPVDDDKLKNMDTADMFSEKEFVLNNETAAVTQYSSLFHLSDNIDDSQGYYNVKYGNIIDNYTIKSTLGQGVFANVVLARDNTEKSDVAIKIMRNDMVIYKMAIDELSVLREINDADPEGRHHCVKYIRHFMFKGHLCIVLEPLFMDMRNVINKYGKHHGLNMKAVISYSRQLLMALRLLKKLGVVHADIKPDNILVNEKKNILKLCDFGASSKVTKNEVTPYLVSRFYRAPEIILGVAYKYSIDIWSAACTIYEMATGRIMFTGYSNNKMLKLFMDLKGFMPHKMLRKGKFKDKHFNYKNDFILYNKNDTEKYTELSTVSATRNLLAELQKHYKSATPEIESKITQLNDFLHKMLILDPNQRLSVSNCLKHPFIQEPLFNNS